MLPQLCFPRVPDRELDSVEMVSNAQHRPMARNQDAVERNSFASMAMGGKDISLPPSANLVAGPEHGDVVEIQSLAKNPDTSSFLTRRDDTLSSRHAYSTAPGTEESSAAGSEFASPFVELGRPDSENDIHAPNIIIFGEAGVGKSSVVNLVAGQKRAHISNDALGCTFQYRRHVITLNGKYFAFWDTSGLDEGSEGTVPAKLAESNLRELIQRLAHSGGIHLLIYCIRGTRLTKALKHNYDLFYSAVCRKKVPVALVVTGLEHQQGSMETWWDENEMALQRCGMWFHAHACVTTLDVDDAVIQAQRSYSQGRLRDLVTEYAGRPPWKIEASSISWATFRNILRGVSSTGKKSVRRVMICDNTFSCQPAKRLIGSRQLEYELVYANDPLKSPTLGKSVGVLVFYTSPLLDTRISSDDLDALKAFHDAAGGKTCPMIVVLRGCHDERVAQSCWDAVASDIQAYPTADNQAKVDAMIEKLCIEVVEDKPSILHKAYEAAAELFAAVVRWKDLLAMGWWSGATRRGP